MPVVMREGGERSSEEGENDRDARAVHSTFPAWRDPNIESKGIRAGEWFYGRQYTEKAWLVFLGLSRPSGPSSLTLSVHHTTPRRPSPRLAPTPPLSLVRITLLPLRPVPRTVISTQTGFSSVFNRATLSMRTFFLCAALVATLAVNIEQALAQLPGDPTTTTVG